MSWFVLFVFQSFRAGWPHDGLEDVVSVVIKYTILSNISIESMRIVFPSGMLFLVLFLVPGRVGEGADRRGGKGNTRKKLVLILLRESWLQTIVKFFEKSG